MKLKKKKEKIGGIKETGRLLYKEENNYFFNCYFYL